MSNDDGRALSYLIAGFGLGTVVGTVIGLLVAPKAGRELRADLAEYGKDYLDKAKDVSRDAYQASREQARGAYEAGRERATDYSARVGERLAEVKEQLGEATQRLGEAVKATYDKQAEQSEEQEQPAE